MSIRKFLVFVILFLSSCITLPDCFNKDVFCAGLVTNTLGIDDHGVNQNTWAGMQEAASNGLVDRVDYIESVDTRDYEKNIAYFAERGYDVIITTGVGMDNETLRGADLYPDSVFVGMDQPQEEVRPNLVPITFAEDQMGFVAGVLAARISETRIVGAVCETSGIDSMWRYCEGFRAGAKFIDDQIKIQVIYREDGDREKLFIDEAWGYETGQTLIHRGADVIFAAGGVTGQGALRAAVDSLASLSAGAQVYSIGTELDQGVVLGESNSKVVTSILGNASFEVQNVMRLVKDGNINELGLSHIRFVPFNQKFPESLTFEMNTLLLKLWNGEIRTYVPFKKP